MNIKENFDLNMAKEIIEYGLTQFYTNDKILIDNDVSERSTFFRIGYYMADKIKQYPLFKNISIDCEYNRNLKSPKRMYKKTLEGIKEKLKDAMPNLLMHERGKNENNLMLIEFEKFNQKQSQDDIKKLKYFTNNENEYKYKFGFIVILNKNNSAKIHIYQNGIEFGNDYYTWKLEK